MVHGRFWLKLLESAWKERSVVWLAGVRRVGKTCLCQDLPEVEYFDCELPRVRRMMLDPESFLDGLVGKRIVLDEIHRLQNPGANGLRTISIPQILLHSGTNMRKAITSSSLTMWSVLSPAGMVT
jgi:predicted AAA+ superfamily ATPase